MHNPVFTPRSLGLDIRPDFDAGTMQAEALLTVVNFGQGAVDSVPFQVGRLLSVVEVADAAGAPLAFEQDVVVYEDESRLQVNQVCVDLGVAVPEGGASTIRVRYEGVLVGYTEVGWRYVQDRIDRVFTILREDAFAFPVLGRASFTERKAAPRSEFEFRLRVTVPADLVVCCGTPERDILEDGADRIWVFESEAPVPFLNVAIGPYARLVERGITVAHFREDAEGAARLISSLHRAMDTYAAWFGPLEEAPQFGLTEIPEGWGSQASLRAGVIMTADAFRSERPPIGLYHELAHLWHPPLLDAPTPRWTEGLGTFLGYRMFGEIDGGDVQDRIRGVWDRLGHMLERDPRLESTPMVDYGKHLLTDAAYPVGCCMFYALFVAMGAPEFDRVVGDYFTNYRPTGATTEQFAEAMEGDAADRVLQRWLYSTEWAVLRRDGAPFEEAVLGLG